MEARRDPAWSKREDVPFFPFRRRENFQAGIRELGVLSWAASHGPCSAAKQKSGFLSRRSAPGPVFLRELLRGCIMKGNGVPLQSEPHIQKQPGEEACPAFARAVSFHRRRLLQLLGAGALGLGLPAMGQGAAQAAASGEVPSQPFWEPAGMDVLTAIFTRRTQREYTGEPVPKEVLDRILAAGMNAPSAHNTQPWSFVVFTKQASLARIPKLIPYT